VVSRCRRKLLTSQPNSRRASNAEAGAVGLGLATGLTLGVARRSGVIERVLVDVGRVNLDPLPKAAAHSFVEQHGDLYASGPADLPALQARIAPPLLARALVWDRSGVVLVGQLSI
jgi:hypothetical protein